MSHFERVNVTLTDRQYKLLLLEANATGLKVGTIIRMLLHDDIASGRAIRHYRMHQAAMRAKNDPESVANREEV